jgi:hypothetical protein
MNLHIIRPLEPQGVWAIKTLQQSVLRAMHLATCSPGRPAAWAKAGMMERSNTGSGRMGCRGR